MVEVHLSACQRCGTESEHLKSIINLLDANGSRPSVDRPDEFWNTFAFRVAERIRRAEENPRLAVSVGTFIRKAFVLHRRPLYGFAAGLATLAVFLMGLLIVRQIPQPKPDELAEQPVIEQQVPVELVSDRLHQYFRKSKVLLIGIANMKTDESDPIDLSTERKVSRELIHEARYLQNYPLDTRSIRLMGDLEKILIELANTKEQEGLPGVEILRGGIHQENLLFKIRMAESLYDTSQFVQANDKY
jgi:hypothetical protein